MEATAAALPVVTTDVRALSEAVRVGPTDDSGLIVPPGDVAALHAVPTHGRGRGYNAHDPAVASRRGPTDGWR